MEAARATAAMEETLVNIFARAGMRKACVERQEILEGESWNPVSYGWRVKAIQVDGWDVNKGGWRVRLEGLLRHRRARDVRTSDCRKEKRMRASSERLSESVKKRSRGLDESRRKSEM